jgi:hypothetical protein
MIITIDPVDAVHVGLYQRASGDAALMAMITGVFDNVPEHQARPYVTIGDLLSSPSNEHGRPGAQISVTFHTWTEARSSRPGDAIGARLVALFDRQHDPLDALVAGHTVWMVRHEFQQNLTDPTPGIRHRVDRFRIYTSQED